MAKSDIWYSQKTANGKMLQYFFKQNDIGVKGVQFTVSIIKIVNNLIRY